MLEAIKGFFEDHTNTRSENLGVLEVIKVFFEDHTNIYKFSNPIYPRNLFQELSSPYFHIPKKWQKDPSAMYIESIKPLFVLHSGLKREWFFAHKM